MDIPSKASISNLSINLSQQCEVVESPSLEVYEKCGDVALRDTV